MNARLLILKCFRGIPEDRKIELPVRRWGKKEPTRYLAVQTMLKGSKLKKLPKKKLCTLLRRGASVA